MDKKNHYGEWQEEKNVFGGVRRYRILADGTKEYEQTIITSKYGEVTLSQLEKIHKRVVGICCLVYCRIGVDNHSDIIMAWC